MLSISSLKYRSPGWRPTLSVDKDWKISKVPSKKLDGKLSGGVLIIRAYYAIHRSTGLLLASLLSLDIKIFGGI